MIRDAKVVDGDADDGRVMRRSDNDVQESTEVVCRHGHMMKQVKIVDNLLEAKIKFKYASQKRTKYFLIDDTSTISYLQPFKRYSQIK